MRLSAVLSLSVAAGFALAEARMMMEDFGPSIPDFEIQTRASWRSGGAPGAAQPSFLRGSTIAALGDGAVVLDDDSGVIARVDGAGKRLAGTSLGRGLAQLVADPIARQVFATDRVGDRVVVLDADDLEVSRRFATPAEPYGLALTPDRASLLVTTIADRHVTAYDPATGVARWSLRLIAEPRGVTVSPDGRQAVVSFVDAATVARVSLGATPAVRYETLPAAPRRRSARFNRRHRNTADGDRFVRSAFATTFIGNDTVIVAHQTSSPRQVSEGAEVTSSYGGGGPESLPVDHRLTALHAPRAERALGSVAAQFLVGVHQPRAMVYDARRDLLLVAGYGSDDVMAIANASGAGARMLWRSRIVGGTEGCGPTGIDLAADGALLINCSLARRVARVPLGSADAPSPAAAVLGDEIGKSRMSDEARRGRSAFRRGGDATMSAFGVLACESCHPEARTDGLSWRIEGKSLQTPMLNGRVAGTHPFKWDGGDADLETSLRNTVTRLGGRGISAQTARDLAAYLEQLPRPRTPSVTNRAAVKRGKTLFNDRAIGCARCHGGPALTDRTKHDVATDLDGVDTPSLIGLAHSAPYYHDGSAATLRAVLTEKGTIHGMGRLAALSAQDVDDLVAFLETL